MSSSNLEAGGPVLGLAGRTSAGKTTVASGLSERLGWPVASFGDYVRAQAKQSGLGTERESLQEVGAGLIETLGPECITLRALAHAGLSTDTVPCVIDGIRHESVWTALHELFSPSRMVLVFITVDDETRDQRLSDAGVSAVEGRRWEKHSTEVEVATRLQSLADLTVTMDNNAVARICSWLSETA